jgi:RNA polymerase sigma-70 factor (ECF subfamily)
MSFREDIITHISVLKARARVLTRNNASAEDLVQDTIIKAIRFEHKFEQNNLKAWLLRVMTNIFLSQYRKHNKMEKRFVSTGDEGIDCYMPEKPTTINETRLDIIEALAQMPQEQANLLIMAEVEGHSYKEMAEKLGVPIGTVMSRLFRARDRIGSL